MANKIVEYNGQAVLLNGNTLEIYEPTLKTKNITENGTYNASSDNADGYSSVVVNVSGGGEATSATIIAQPFFPSDSQMIVTFPQSFSFTPNCWSFFRYPLTDDPYAQYPIGTIACGQSPKGSLNYGDGYVAIDDSNFIRDFQCLQATVSGSTFNIRSYHARFDTSATYVVTVSQVDTSS